SQLGPGEHVQSRGRQAPGVGTIMIAPCTQFYFQPPHLEPTHDVLVPELIHADGGGGQCLVGPAEHLIHLLNRGGQKDADVLVRHTMIQFQHAQYAVKRGKWTLTSSATWLIDSLVRQLDSRSWNTAPLISRSPHGREPS